MKKLILINLFLVFASFQTAIWAGGQKEQKKEDISPPGVLDMAESGDLASLEKLLKVDVDLNEKNSAGLTALHIASQKGNQTIVDLLLATGADTNAQDNEGRTPLQIASENNNTKIMSQLVQFGADITLADRNGRSPASITINKPVNQLLAIVNKNNVNKKLANDSYLVHLASANGQHENLKALIEIGADIRLLDSEKRLAVDLAFQAPVNLNKIICADLLMRNASPVPADPVWKYAGEVMRTGNYSQRLEYGTTAFHLAAENNQEAMIRFLIDKGLDTNIRDQAGNTALHIASRLGYVSMALLLLENNAMINARDYTQNTPVHDSVSAGDSFFMMETLFENGAEPNVKNSSGDTPLHLAVALPESREALDLLLSNNADINARNRSGSTPLHISTKSGNKAASQFLIKNNADIFAQDNTGKSPADIALGSGPEVIEWFFYNNEIAKRIDNTGRGTLHMAVNQKADKESILTLLGKEVDPNLRDYNGDSPLHYVASGRYIEIFTVLLENGASMFIENNESQTPLSTAFASGIAYTGSILKGKLKIMDTEGNIPLFHSVLWGYDRITQALIDEGSDIAHVNSKGQTALHLAVYVRSVSAASILIKAGLNPDTTDLTGRAPLHDAATWGVPGIINLLALNGADVNLPDSTGQTPLHRASFSGEATAAKRLLGLNAQINFTDNNGQTPLFIAAQADRESIINLFIANGADITLRDSQGRTALHVAILNQSKKSIRKLVDTGSDIFASDSKGLTPIQIAITDNPPMIRSILNSTSVNKQDNMGNTPLHIAVLDNASIDVVELILSMGARKTIRNAQGQTPVELAQKLNNGPLTEILR